MQKNKLEKKSNRLWKDYKENSPEFWNTYDQLIGKAKKVRKPIRAKIPVRVQPKKKRIRIPITTADKRGIIAGTIGVAVFMGWLLLAVWGRSGEQFPVYINQVQNRREHPLLHLNEYPLTYISFKGGKVHLEIDKQQRTWKRWNRHKLATLQSLVLSNNKLRAMPAEMNQLLRLRLLDLGYNQIEGIPAEIGQLTSLEVLDLSHNILQNLPKEISQLHRLKTLNLTGNKLKTLPNGMYKLQNLEELNLEDNHFRGLSLADFKKMKSLKMLYLGGNPMSDREKINIKLELPGCIVHF